MILIDPLSLHIGQYMNFSFSFFWDFLTFQLHHFLKSNFKPSTATLTLGMLTDFTRSKPDLIAENTILRQQLIVLKRQIKRPQLTPGDRFRLVLLAMTELAASRIVSVDR